MKSNVILVSCLFITTGCVTVKAPENLVSDSVRAGKNLYHSVKDEMSESKDESNRFKFSYQVPENESHAISSSKCIDAAVEKAKKALNKYSVEVKQTESNVAIENGRTTLNCSVSI
ncbi:hypothetical protein [Colwellia psychrerythraea]|uniref:Lipoprotein n=1 Tax=Colwellia psychrerythraea TaxID=28229 RepID=A0A099KLW8_COLPS|nr:hypothetical protein [Colwellia psychrerythraea]KGJ91759.1 hypothetical protein GAB14E_3241 [Colwellia psychrerythraea]